MFEFLISGSNGVPVLTRWQSTLKIEANSSSSQVNLACVSLCNLPENENGYPPNRIYHLLDSSKPGIWLTRCASIGTILAIQSPITLNASQLCKRSICQVTNLDLLRVTACTGPQDPICHDWRRCWFARLMDREPGRQHRKEKGVSGKRGSDGSGMKVIRLTS